jgi:hypothetical protein
MTLWLSLLVPLMVMFFALGMERVEAWMQASPLRRDELDDLLERAGADEVRALSRPGIERALELFRLRIRSRATPRDAAPRFASSNAAIWNVRQGGTDQRGKPEGPRYSWSPSRR